MKIGMINGSPKVKDSASGELCEMLNKLLEEKNQIMDICINSKKTEPSFLEDSYRCDAIIFVLPLYVDGIPSHLLRFMEQLQDYLMDKEPKEIYIYSIVNNGFFEGKQAILALQIFENWCERSGLLWGMGVGVGAGGMLSSVRSVPLGHGPKKSLGEAYTVLVGHITKLESGVNIFINPNFPRFIYITAAHMGWKMAIKNNGLKKRDLLRQISSGK